MDRLGGTITARGVFRGALTTGLLFMLAANLPGHLSYDSVAQLYEGHFHVRNTWGPAIYAWLLGFFDGFVPGTALYVVASALLLFVSLGSFERLRGRVGWLGVAITVLVLLTPQVLVYQAIVWKDVMFANTAIAGVVCLAHAATRWDERRRRWVLLVLALVLLALAAQVRQNGILVTFAAVLALGWTGAQGKVWRGLAWAVGGAAAVIAMALLMNQLAEKPNAEGAAGATGVRIVQTYDLIGALSLDRSYRIPELAAAEPGAAAVLLRQGPMSYTGVRVDFLDRDPAIGAATAMFSDEEIGTAWKDLILKRPLLYLRVRWEDFRWVFLTPVVDRCLAIYTGVDAPAEKMQPMGLVHRYTHADRQLTNYTTWYLDTPAYSHAAYALLALVLGIAMLIRHEPADLFMAALMAGALGFAASFFVISIACDYRYLYFVDLAALTGLIYLAVDPPWRKRT